MKPKRPVRHPSATLPGAIAYAWWGATITVSVVVLYACATMMAVGRQALKPRKRSSTRRSS